MKSEENEREKYKVKEQRRQRNDQLNDFNIFFSFRAKRILIASSSK